jgi:hypothetical protein
MVGHHADTEAKQSRTGIPYGLEFSLQILCQMLKRGLSGKGLAR